MAAERIKVTQGQVVAATLRQVASTLHKLADSLDAEANQGKPRKKEKPVSLVQLWKDGKL